MIMKAQADSVCAFFVSIVLSAIFIFVISHIATATPPLPKPKNVSKITHDKIRDPFQNSFSNYFVLPSVFIKFVVYK